MALPQRYCLLTVSAFAGISLLVSSSLMAWDGLVEKQTFKMENFTTTGPASTNPETGELWGNGFSCGDYS